MTIKIVTDSTSDITSDIATKWGISVVPLTVTFGHESFLDRVDISTDEFYRRLTSQNVFPTTTQPSPQKFADTYSNLADETDEILVIVISSKLSGTYESALSAINMIDKKVNIEVIDSKLTAMGMGMSAIWAAEQASSGVKLSELKDQVIERLNNTGIVISFDTLKYLAKGGRIGKAAGFLGSLLSLRPILTFKDGELAPMTRVRSKSASMDVLNSFVGKYDQIDEIAIECATNCEDADMLSDRFSPVVPPGKIIRSTVSPVLGAYAGPGVLAVSVTGKTG
jgi:DegV family protein with EDD domain